jgi:hypothetical protein
MTEERKHAILFAATLLCARKVQPYLEGEGANCLTEHFIWRAIEQAKRIADKIDDRWPSGQQLSTESK